MTAAQLWASGLTTDLVRPRSGVRPPEAAHNAEGVKHVEPLLSPAAGIEAAVMDLGTGEQAVLVQQTDQDTIPVGQP